jgi:hypothetical protein
MGEPTVRDADAPSTMWPGRTTWAPAAGGGHGQLHGVDAVEDTASSPGALWIEEDVNGYSRTVHARATERRHPGPALLDEAGAPAAPPAVAYWHRPP